MPSPVVQVRIPEPVLTALDEARGQESRSAWVLGAIGLRLSPLTEVVAELTDPATPVIPAAPIIVLPPGTAASCKHPKQRVIKGFCYLCGSGGL